MTYKNSTIKLSILITIFIVVSLSGCFSEWHGDLAQIVISFGGAERALGYDADDSDTHQQLEYRIALSCPSEMKEFDIQGNKTFEAYLMPGKWIVLINSYYKGEIYATGSKEVILKPGQNNETINMYKSLQTEVPGWTLAEKLKWLSENAVGGKDYLIRLIKDESLAPHTLSYDGKIIKITLIGDTRMRTVRQLRPDKPDSPLFLIDPGVTLILDKNITLKGRSGNNSRIISVNEKFIMKAGSKITDNNFKDGWMAGVYIAKDAVFEMNGGEISGIVAPGGGAVWVEGTFTMNNDAKICNNESTDSSGAGVWVVRGGKFFMNGGEISGNTANDGGGGVFVFNGGAFTMTNGIISGNNTSAGDGGGVGVTVWAVEEIPLANSTFTMSGGTISGNTASSGGGVSVENENADYYSTFTMSGGTISGNTARDNGGGVKVWNGKFNKQFGGIISGNNATSGQAVFADSNVSGSYVEKKRDNNIQSTDTLSYDEISSTTSTFGWDSP